MNPTPEQVARWAREAGFSWPQTVESKLQHLVMRAFIEGRAYQAEQVAAWVEGQRNDIPATGSEFAAAIRANAPKK